MQLRSFSAISFLSSSEWSSDEFFKSFGIFLNLMKSFYQPRPQAVGILLESFGQPRTQAVGILWNLLSSSELLSSSWSILGALGLKSISSLVLSAPKYFNSIFGKYLNLSLLLFLSLKYEKIKRIFNETQKFVVNCVFSSAIRMW